LTNLSEGSLLPPATWPPAAPPGDGRYGRATITPDAPVVAGMSGTWTLTYTAGKYGIDDGGAVRIALHTISDWGSPQLAEPAAPDYWAVSWTAPAPCRIEARFDGDLGIRPWKRVLQLRVRDQAVRPGDAIRIVAGDRRGGSPGARAQTFAGTMRCYVLLDAYGTGIFEPVGAPLALAIVPGPPDHLRVHAPSDVAAGEPFDVTVAVRDRWGNVARSWREARHFDEAGVQSVFVTDTASGLRGESNPVRVAPLAGRGEPLCASPRLRVSASSQGSEGASAHRVFWGDLHAQTEETIGSGTLDEYFSFARDCAAIDFVGHQGNDFQITDPVLRANMAKTL